MRIIIGLGNPGDKFKTTRHNVGFMTVDLIAQQNGLSWKENKKFKAQITEGTDFILVKPQTFMNLSGQSALTILRYYKLIPSSLFGIKKETDLSSVLTVIHDELDLNFGDFKVSLNSGSAGHNGVQSIMDHLKTKTFKRIRIGISNDTRKQIPTENFVLQRFSLDEEKKLTTLLPEISKQI